DRNGAGRGPLVSSELHGLMVRPSNCGTADRFESGLEFVGIGGWCIGPTRPHDDFSAMPGGLQAYLTDRIRSGDRRNRGSGVVSFGEKIVGRFEAREFGLEVVDDLLSLTAAQAADRFETVLDLLQEVFEGPPPRSGIGFEPAQLFGGGLSLGCRPCSNL